MKTDFLFSPGGYLVLLSVFVAILVAGVIWQKNRNRPLLVAPARQLLDSAMPKTLTRDGARFAPSPAPRTETLSPPATQATPLASESPKTVLPLRLYGATPAPKAKQLQLGRLIACETVLASHSVTSNPIVAVVAEDCWQDGRLLVRAGTEVHGRVSGPRRDRIVAALKWTMIGDENSAVPLEALALDSEGAEGLVGTIEQRRGVKEAKIFGSTFLAAASAALQDARTTISPFGESAIPAATARNAALAGTATVIRDYSRETADSLRDDVPLVTIPAGKRFYLYLTQDATFQAAPPPPNAHEKN